MARKRKSRRTRRPGGRTATAPDPEAPAPEAARPTRAELRAIVRGADALVMRAGRTLLAQILRGSRAQEVLERGWQRLPVYGLLSHLSIKGIRQRIDWAIQHDFLQIERDRGTPLLCLGPAGWELDRAIYVEEILADFVEKLSEPNYLGDYMYLQEINPEILVQVLDEIRRRDGAAFAPVLRAWRGFAAGPVQRRIDRVLTALEPQA